MDVFYKNEDNDGTLKVFRVNNARGHANLFFFNDPAPSGTTLVPGVIISDISYTQTARGQFQQSLGNVIYVYAFGDDMGSLEVSGMAFPRVCNSSANGISNLLKFYKQYKITNAVSKVRITLANEVITGFLVGLNVSTVSADSGVHKFVMSIKTIPAAYAEIKRGSAAASGAATG